ncbi:YHS domain-containing protein (plasmid) [Burkholderia thailandensis]|uniref:YHS domain-containing protein n=1 Tax=Burkholderia thailandensis TaxID=57975 RepID=UPI00192E19B8|nr:YHS domain-containing protein [Burkholderia thailandensis]MBS2132184.1 YHS domain-containing protein [Burkholderia thailandensis]QRA15281.1 YHS domain-containing protein [Burkholderia thailandensis]
MKTKDPVCGMDIDSDAAFAVETHTGRTYYLCSASCRDKFRSDPARYAGTEQHEHKKRGCGCHGSEDGPGCC